jgi:hypothetical protein
MRFIIILLLCISALFINAAPQYRSIIFKTKAPEGTINPCALIMNNSIRMAKEGRLKKSFARKDWQDYGLFFHWAVWAYLSGDSNYQGDEELLKMIRVWLDKAFVRLQTKSAKLKGKKAKAWKPNIINSWNFQYYSIPLLEIMQDRKAVSVIGLERLDKLKSIIAENMKNYNKKVMADQLKRHGNYINMLYHPFPMYLSYWLLFDNKAALDFCEKTNQHMLRQQSPNGSYPYRLQMYSDKKHRESDSMYYHAVINRGLYLHWWYSGSKSAGKILKNSIPYYPLSLEPPYHFSSGADIWWKDQWRTFWSQHSAMVAAMTGDGENAAIARRMGRDRKSLDYFDAVVGAHAFRLMAEKKIKDKPQRNNYLIKDPDIRGMRSRWGNWSTTFSTGSYGFTRTSAMLTDGKKFDALHLARPVFRARQYSKKAYKIEPGVYDTLGRSGAEFSSVIKGKVGVVGTSYHQSLTSMTWRPKQPQSPWRTDELWLITPDGLVGLISSTLGKDCEGYEIMHQYRFIRGHSGKTKDVWSTGKIAFKVWATDFKNKIQERARRYIYDAKRKMDSQLTLTDVKRSPLEVIHDRAATKTLPQKKKYSKGVKYFSLVSVSPPGKEPKAVKLISSKGLISFAVTTVKGKKYLVSYNPTSEKIKEISSKQVSLVTPH